jgi:hypothetical protein
MCFCESYCEEKIMLKMANISKIANPSGINNLGVPTDGNILQEEKFHRLPQPQLTWGTPIFFWI